MRFILSSSDLESDAGFDHGHLLDSVLSNRFGTFPDGSIDFRYRACPSSGWVLASIVEKYLVPELIERVEVGLLSAGEGNQVRVYAVDGRVITDGESGVLTETSVDVTEADIHEFIDSLPVLTPAEFLVWSCIMDDPAGTGLSNEKAVEAARTLVCEGTR